MLYRGKSISFGTVHHHPTYPTREPVASPSHYIFIEQFHVFDVPLILLKELIVPAFHPLPPHLQEATTFTKSKLTVPALHP